MHSFYETTLKVIFQVAGIDYDLFMSGAPPANALDIPHFVTFSTILLFISSIWVFILLRECLSTKHEAKEE